MSVRLGVSVRVRVGVKVEVTAISSGLATPLPDLNPIGNVEVGVTDLGSCGRAGRRRCTGSSGS